MNKMIKTVFAALALVALFGPMRPAFAVGGVVVSSTIPNIVPAPAFTLKPGESANWSVAGPATGTIHLERSHNLQQWEILKSSAVVNWPSSGLWTGTVYSDDKSYFYRFRASTITGGGFVTRIQDNNDFVTEIKNKKGLPILRVFDDTVDVIGQVNEGTGKVVQSTATDSGSTGKSMPACLSGDTAAVEGSVLIATTPVSSCADAPLGGLTVAVAPLTLDLTSWVGAAKAAASTGSIVDVYYSGFVFVRSTGTVAVGDTVVSTPTARGYVGSDTTPTTGADIGVAMSAGNAAGGLIKVRLR